MLLSDLDIYRTTDAYASTFNEAMDVAEELKSLPWWAKLLMRPTRIMSIYLLCLSTKSKDLLMLSDMEVEEGHFQYEKLNYFLKIHFGPGPLDFIMVNAQYMIGGMAVTSTYKLAMWLRRIFAHTSKVISTLPVFSEAPQFSEGGSS